MNTETKKCQDCKEKFTISSEEKLMYERIGVVEPKKCFFCRVKQHLAFWVFGKFRKGVSDLSGESLITVLPEKVRHPIYKSKEWWGDGWDPMAFGRPFDPIRSFFEQLKELQEKTPRAHQTGDHNTGCDWCDDVWESKNCYLARSMLRCENLSYGYRCVDIKDSIDLAYCFKMDQSYDDVFCFNSYNLMYSKNCRDCIDSFFLFDCRNCTNCFMCWNSRNKSYCILNKQYSKEEYQQKISEYDLSSQEQIKQLKKEYQTLLQKEAIHRPNFNFKTINSTGNFLTNCRNCINAFNLENAENCYNFLRGLDNKDIIDLTGCWSQEFSGNDSCCTKGYQLKYSSWSESRYSEYLDLCYDCEYCFGCVGLRKKKYCILNIQYSKEEYEKLRSLIIEQMERDGVYGEFLPYNMGLAPYNMTTGMMYFPQVTKVEIEKHNGYWEDIIESKVEGLPTSELPDNIKDVPDDFTTQALICPETGYRFNIAPHELEFYKRKKIPLPRVHFDARTLKRVSFVTVLKAYTYKCVYCEKSIEAYYPPEWGYKKIACEECYKNEVL